MEEAIVKKIVLLKEQYPNLVVVIYWPTATWKSWLSVRLADIFANHNNQWVEIISADSRQVYRYMDIGTDKISLDIRNKIKHYAIDIINPDEEYTAHKRQKDTKNWVSEIHSRNNIPFIVGWTGLYIDTIYKNFSLPPDVKANRDRRNELEKLDKVEPWYAWNLLNSFDSDTAAEFHPKNIRYIIRAIEMYEQTGIPKSILVKENPVDFPLLMISLTRDIDVANNLIKKRVEDMVNIGLIEEVKSLLNNWYNIDLQSMNGIGYRQTIERLNQDNKNIEELINSISLSSVQYAKRQRTRFRRYEKDADQHPKDNVFYMKVDMLN